ncbi:DUF808 domain-containing protein [Gilvimarinus sp. DA14]|uniref:DUF808 domain-containing protein n=1 Tax=Gilvimarinus sp. DA14 TaxID=2956798 RepID=UPI0020B867C0|nr:DUF808 domain-containing protein [Gilvimarinus sp. DA14]UTF59201.1 DUF808 domain-containing protein [Gilvimarinus sp. DA14]
MAGSSLLTLIDDIATLLDDVAVMTKVAAKKTAGVLGDDLALNAEQVTGVRAERELPVVWAVFKGSLVNKFILVPAALLISAFLPWLIVPLLMLGGAYLCFEGFEKIAHKWLHPKAPDDREHQARLQALAQSETDMLAFEKNKIKGAIRTDFILSAEIITITLGAVSGAALSSQIAVLCIIALGMTVGVYGLVAGIVKMDDAGLHLSAQTSQAKQKLGQFLLAAAPVLMKFLSIAGTAAMFLVGGGILVHGIGPVHHFVEHLAHSGEALPTWGIIFSAAIPTLINALVGLLAGAVLVGAITLGGKLLGKKDQPS